MIIVQGLGFSFPQAAQPVLDNVSFTIAPGELVLVVGPSGSGKSTLLRCLNGLVPHFHGGLFSGQVVVDGRDTRDHQPRDLADAVGMVFQEPESQMVAETVTDEITFGMENLGLPRAAMRKRIEEVLDLLRIASLRDRRLDSLSGGELQRVAIAAVLAMQPRILLLDEPTSQLDPQAAEELLTTVQRLSDDLGLTVLIAEHRLERVVQYADRLLYLPGDGSLRSLDVREAMASLPLAPPVARLGRALGWTPVPLSVREGRRFAAAFEPRRPPAETNGSLPTAGATVVTRDLSVSYENLAALRGVSFEAYPGQVLALMGRNGSGKTTLLRTLVGLVRPEGGTALVLDRDVAGLETEELARDVALVPQEPSALLYHQTVEEEIADTLGGTGRHGSVDEALTEWGLETLRATHPADLSAGERQRAALAAMLVGRPPIVLLDEPTRGMDYETKERLVENLKRRCREGCTVILASHDVELAGRCADRVLLLADGQVAVEGPARAVLTDTLTFSTQVNKLLGGTYLTPEDVLGETTESLQ
ncbi:MAG: energy-coupling factor ABC transporter ATP-binding protein [Chloroflexi bacterium]|nr:energy-coupling factor ABC transporter ATP-binding protein [Chloroflexota bacterium]